MPLLAPMGYISVGYAKKLIAECSDHDFKEDLEIKSREVGLKACRLLPMVLADFYSLA